VLDDADLSRLGVSYCLVHAPHETPTPSIPAGRPGRINDVSAPVSTSQGVTLLRRGRVLEVITLAWNVVGMIVLGVAAVRAGSVALAGFGLDSLIEVGASTVVLWELSGTGEARRRRGLRLIAAAFLALAAYMLVQATIVFATGSHPQPSPLGITWTAITAAAMFALAAGKNHTGHALHNRVLTTEARVTVMDGLLACAVLLGLALNATIGWWWADPAAGLVIVYYATEEARTIYTELSSP
jgi:divalent metal cation (Fe/Co/Zn/Cd) transporter